MSAAWWLMLTWLALLVGFVAGAWWGGRPR